MIIIIPVNGLLNRIRSILSAKLIADTLKDKLYVLWLPEKCCNCYYEDIFENNNHLWEGICCNNIEAFKNKYNINPDIIPLYFNEKNNTCTLRGYGRGEQPFMPKFISSLCPIKIIKAGGNFYDPSISKKIYNQLRMELYSNINFSKEIITKIPIVKKNTLGIHLRYTDRRRYAPSTNELLRSVIKMNKENIINNIIIVSDDLRRGAEIVKMLEKHFPTINICISNIKIRSRANSAGLQCAMVDWLTLCNCEYLIFFTGSSFGYEAFIWNLNRIVDEIPKRQLLNELS